MFNELVESVSTRKKTNTTWGIIASLSVQCACLLALILIPLIYTQALPSTIFGSVLIAPPPPPTPPQTILKALAAHRARLFEHNVLQAPSKIPGRVEIFRKPGAASRITRRVDRPRRIHRHKSAAKPRCRSRATAIIARKHHEAHPPGRKRASRKTPGPAPARISRASHPSPHPGNRNPARHNQRQAK